MPRKLPALTAAALARVKATDRQFEIRDGEVPGLLLRVYPLPRGTMRWNFRARQDGRLRLIVIGDFPKLSLKVARAEARDLRRRLDGGERPADERTERRSEPTLGELWKEYTARHKKAERSSKEDRGRWARHLEVFQHRQASTVTKKELVRLLHKIAEGAPFEANRTLALIRHLYRWSIDVELISCANPALGIRPEAEAPRERPVSAAEMKKLLKAISAEPDPIWQGYFLLLLLTGCRRGELLRARWAWVHNDLIEIPREATKQKRPHLVVLSEYARQVLEQLPSRGTSTYLFPGDSGGPRVEPKRSWASILERAGLADLRIHDLRHAVGSSLGSAGENAFLIRGALGHSQLSTTQRYVQHEVEATRRAMEGHAERMRAIVNRKT